MDARAVRLGAKQWINNPAQVQHLTSSIWHLSREVEVMLSKGYDPIEIAVDRSGRRWEYQLLVAGSMELGRLRAEMRRLASAGWELDRAYGELEQDHGMPAAGEQRLDGELHVWLRRPIGEARSVQMPELFMAAA